MPAISARTDSYGYDAGGTVVVGAAAPSHVGGRASTAAIVVASEVAARNDDQAPVEGVVVAVDHTAAPSLQPEEPATGRPSVGSGDGEDSEQRSRVGWGIIVGSCVLSVAMVGGVVAMIYLLPEDHCNGGGCA